MHYNQAGCQPAPQALSMARFRPARNKAKPASEMPRAGLPCLVLVIVIMILTMALMYFALKSSGS